MVFTGFFSVTYNVFTGVFFFSDNYMEFTEQLFSATYLVFTEKIFPFKLGCLLSGE